MCSQNDRKSFERLKTTESVTSWALSMLAKCFITCTLYIIMCDEISYILLLLMGEHHGAIRPSMQIKTNKLGVLGALLPSNI